MFLMLSRFVALTGEQFKQEVADRQMRQRARNATAQQPEFSGRVPRRGACPQDRDVKEVTGFR